MILTEFESKDAEVAARLAEIQEAVLTSGNSYKQEALTKLAEGGSGTLAVHPGGRFWATIEGSHTKTRIVIGAVDGDKLTVHRRLANGQVPSALRFGPDGRLYVGNSNGTIDIFAVAP